MSAKKKTPTGDESAGAKVDQAEGASMQQLTGSNHVGARRALEPSFAEMARYREAGFDLIPLHAWHKKDQRGPGRRTSTTRRASSATTTPARGTPTSPARTSPWPSATRSPTCTRFGASGRGRNRGRGCPGRVFKGRPTRTALLFHEVTRARRLIGYQGAPFRLRPLPEAATRRWAYGRRCPCAPSRPTSPRSCR